MSDTDPIWMISYRYEACFRTQHGVSRNAPLDMVVFSRIHPGRFVADAIQEANALADSPYRPETGPQRADAIIRVHSAVCVPERVLTPDQLASLDDLYT